MRIAARRLARMLGYGLRRWTGRRHVFVREGGYTRVSEHGR